MWQILRTLAAPPEGMAADELLHWAARRRLLRGLLTIVVAPVVLGLMWGVPALREAWAGRYGACATLIPVDEVETLLAVDIHRVRASAKLCSVAFQTLTPAGYHDTKLRVEIDEEHTAAWRLTLLTRGTSRLVDSWDWDRPEKVHVVQHTDDRSVVLIGTDEPGCVELEVHDATDAQVVALVQKVIAAR